jgi:hypothetical protein
MKRKFVMVCAGAFAFAAVAGTAMAATIPSSTVQLCSDQMQNNTLKYINAVQKQVRLSIKNNLNGKDSKCSGGAACAGSTTNGKACSTNAFCSTGIPMGSQSQCSVNVAKGVAGAINKAKKSLRAKFAQFCLAGDYTTLGFPNSRCPNADTADEVADCVLQGAIGDISANVFGDPAGEVMARAATDIVPQTTAPLSVCGVTLGSILQIGSASTSATPAEAGGAQQVFIDGACVGTVCQTKGGTLLGNNLTAPTQTFAGLIPVCLVTVTSDAGNLTTQDGDIDLGTGEQNSFAPIRSTVLVGTTCPLCDATSSTCDTGPNAGLPCSAPGATDTACPPTIAGMPSVIPNPLALSTEPTTLSVPANNPVGGANNPAAAFCGACDLDDTLGCQNDADCVALGACSGGVGSGCCGFSASPGAFGNAAATTITTNGKRGPYIPILGTAFCTGKSGSGLVDSSQGLPGPVRLVQEQLNTFEY